MEVLKFYSGILKPWNSLLCKEIWCTQHAYLSFNEFSYQLKWLVVCFSHVANTLELSRIFARYNFTGYEIFHGMLEHPLEYVHAHVLQQKSKRNSWGNSRISWAIFFRVITLLWCDFCCATWAWTDLYVKKMNFQALCHPYAKHPFTNHNFVMLLSLNLLLQCVCFWHNRGVNATAFWRTLIPFTSCTSSGKVSMCPKKVWIFRKGKCWGCVMGREGTTSK